MAKWTCIRFVDCRPVSAIARSLQEIHRTNRNSALLVSYLILDFEPVALWRNRERRTQLKTGVIS